MLCYVMLQQRNPAMSPHTKGKEQAPVQLKNISGENPAKPGGEGRVRKWLTEPCTKEN